LCAGTLHALLRIPRAVAFLENGQGKGAKFKKNFLMKLLGKKRLLAKRLEKAPFGKCLKIDALFWDCASLMCLAFFWKMGGAGHDKR
jgi:hypothetical protein